MSPRLQADLLLAVCALIWGATFVVVKDALSYASVFVFLSLRFALATVLLLVLYRRHLPHLSLPSVRAGAAIGILLFGGFALQTAGLQWTTPSKAAFLTGSCVVLVPVFLGLFGGRRIPGRIWTGALAALAGLYLLTVPASGLRDLNAGDVLVLGCAVLFALHIIAIGHFAPRYSAGTLTLLQVATAAVLTTLAVPVFAVTGFEAPRAQWTPQLWTALAITGVLATVLAFSAMVWAQQRTTASHAAILLTLEPVFAGVTSFLFYGERLGIRALAGAALILGGILMAELSAPAPIATAPLPPAPGAAADTGAEAETEATRAGS